MADEYIHFPIESDPNVLADDAIEKLAVNYPGWEPSAGDIEVQLIEIIASMVSTMTETASDVTKAIFRAWGPINGVPPVEESQATGFTTWVAIDNQGYTVQEGTVVGYRLSGDDVVAFEVVTDVVIPPGSTSTVAGEVEIRAVEPGADGSGLSGSMELMEAIPWVDTVTIVGSTSGGSDAEDDDEYLGRLSRELELISPRPILPDDFAVIAKRVPGVERATAIDGWDPGAGTGGHERMVSVAVHDSDGDPCSGGVKAAVKDLLESMREVSFIVHVIDPSYTTINVSYAAVCHPGFDSAAVQADVDAALSDYLSPASWGLPPTGDDSVHGWWWNRPYVRWLDVATEINNVPGVDYVTSLTVNGGTSDILMSGAVPLPTAGTISGTVS